MCIAGEGCSVGATSHGQLVLSEPIMQAAAASGSSIPVFSVTEFCPEFYIGTLSTLGSPTTADSREMVIQKSRVDPFQTVGFNIVTGTATASQQLQTISMTPQIWRQDSTGDVLVYTGSPTTCTAATACSLDGTFIPVWDIANVTGTFFANVTTLYTLTPEMMAADGGNIPGTVGMIYPTRNNEPVPKIVVTEPLAPQKPGAAENSDGYAILWNSTVEHAVKDGEPVTVIFGPDGQPISRTNDDTAAKIAVPGNRELPATEVYVIPSEAVVNQSSQQNIAVTDPTSWDPVVTVKSDASLVGSPSVFSSGVYYINHGGSVTTTVGNNVFMTPYIKAAGNSPQSTEPSFEVMREEGMDILCNDQNGTLNCAGIFSHSQNTGSDNIPQSLNFSIISDTINQGNPAQVEITAESQAHREGNTLYYTITGKSSEKLKRIVIVPRIFISEIRGPNLTYKAPEIVCTDSDQCTASGTYEMTISGEYFVDGRLNYTTPQNLVMLGSPGNFYLIPESERILTPSNSEKASTNQYIKQVESKDIYLWGYAAGEKNLDTTGEKSPVNVIVYNYDQTNFIYGTQYDTNKLWHTSGGSAGNGYSGQTLNSMTWKSVGLNNWEHLEKGGYFNDQAHNGRYHCPIFNGGYSATLSKNWIFANCHHEWWGTVNGKDNHYVYPQGYNEGRAEFQHDLQSYSVISSYLGQVNYQNSDNLSYHDGYAWVMSAI
jgi:hypothetical protein